ncbi:MAG: hypothetical protein AAGC71_08480 [Pseudomonadota bacterium]
MPEMTAAVTLIALGSLLLGAIVGWLICARRAEHKRLALKAEWNEQLIAQQKAEKRINNERKNLAAELAAVRTKLNEVTRTTDTVTDLASATGVDELPSIDSANHAPHESSAGIGEAADAGEIARLRAALEESYERRDGLRANLTALIERSRKLTHSMTEKDDKIFALSRELESWQQRLPPLVERYRESEHNNTIILEQLEAERTLNTELSNTMRTRIMPLREMSAANSDDAPSSPGSNGNGHNTDPNDLKRIRGVGPVLEKTLNKLGIYSLSQVANFTDEDIERISAELPQFPGRIRRDGWIEQARDLLQ